MLLQFNFKNFKSFRDEVSFDLSATKITDSKDTVREIGKEKVLPMGVVYGGNAYGKSNFIEAFRYMCYFVRDSFMYGPDNPINCPYYKFDDESSSRETEFEVFFIDNASLKTYCYGFSVLNNQISEEWLNCKTHYGKEFKTIFYRNNDETDLSGIPLKSQDNIRIAIQKENLILSLGAKLNVEILINVRNWFLNNEFANFGEPFENFVLSKTLPKDFITDRNIQKKAAKYLSVFDPSIIDFEVISTGNSITVYSVHKKTDSNDTCKINFESESSGTLKMFALYQLLLNVLERGGILSVDELNARLHPLLVRSFLIMFMDKEINKNHAQLIFTSHDISQLNYGGLRRDEIYFTDKSDGVTNLYSLAEFKDEKGDKIRKDENYEKNYLLGKYGAIPELESFGILWEEK